MPKESLTTIDHIEVRKGDIDKVKKVFQVKDNADTIRKALDMAAGKIELETIFEKYRGIKIRRTRGKRTRPERKLDVNGTSGRGQKGHEG